MEFDCKLSIAEMREAYFMNARGRLLLSDLRSTITLAMLLVLIVMNAFSHGRSWGFIAGMLGLAALIVAIRLWRISFLVKRMAKRINAACERMTVDVNGIGTANVLGTATFSPWSQFRGWREGKLVFTVGDAKAFRTIPKSAVSEMQVGEVRGILQTQIR